MRLEDYRNEFPIFREKIYLNTCSLGALSVRHREYMNTFLRLWDDLGASAWYEHWIGALNDVRRMAARVLNAAEDEIALGHSVSTLLGTLASCFSFGERRGVVVTDLDFPTANYQWLARRRRGVHTHIIASPDGVSVPAAAFYDAVDETTAVVSTSHVFFGSGCIQDVRSITRHARQKGAVAVIDAYQSAGQIPVDVHEMELDILITGGLKWLLGGPGITFMYVRRELAASLQPAAAGWFGVKNQFGFDQTRFDFLDGARRFETGTPAAAAVYAAKAGLELILEIGLESIQKKTKELAEELIHELKKAGFTLRTAGNPDERSAIVMIAHSDPAPVVGKLADDGIIVDHRKDNIRVSPYFYNTAGDIARFTAALKQHA